MPDVVRQVLAPRTPPPRMPRGTHLKTLKKLIGVIVSTGMDRTVVVAVPRLKLHSKTRKFMHHVTKYFCHDHHEICGVGDKVHIKPCGQLSKKKHWTIIDILARHPQLGGEPFPMSKLRLPLEEYAAIMPQVAAAGSASSSSSSAKAKAAAPELR